MARKKRKTTRPAKPFQLGNPGRPKGAVNKFTTLKKSFLNVFDRMGGEDELLEFAKTHKAMFYQMITKLFPQEVEQSGNVNVAGKMIVEVIHVKDGPVKPGGGNGDGIK